jgi:hypothetical protein
MQKPLSVVRLEDGREIRTYRSDGPDWKQRVVLWDMGVETELERAMSGVPDESGRRRWTWWVRGEQGIGVEGGPSV